MINIEKENLASMQTTKYFPYKVSSKFEYRVKIRIL